MVVSPLSAHLPAPCCVTGPGLLCSLLRPLRFSGPQFLGRLVCECLKSPIPQCFAVCSANSRTLLARALCPGFGACNAPAHFANCHRVPAKLLSRSMHLCHRPPAAPSLCHIPEDIISSSQGICIFNALTITHGPSNSSTHKHSLLQFSAPRQWLGQVTHAD